MNEEKASKKAGEPVVIEVIPIVRGIGKATLTYFSSEVFPVGTFVRVPVRSGETLGIVVRTYSARERKANLKDAPFALKKLKRVESEATLSPMFIKAVEKTAIFYGTTIGSALSAILPKVFLENPELVGGHGSSHKSPGSREPLLIQLEDEDRFREYKSLVRENFARGKSVLFIAPTHEDAVRSCDILSKGIERYTYLTSRKSPAKLKAHLKEACENKHPILFVTTQAFMSFDRPDIDSIVLEKENSSAYRALARPFIHPRVFLRFLAKETGRNLILGDSILSMETLWREREGEYAEFSPLKWRMKGGARAEIIDMKSKRGGERLEPKDFTVISRELRMMIEEAVRERRKVFLFGVRKGLAPSTVCGDCGSVLGCKNCGAPVVLYEKKNPETGSKEPLYICHACGARRDPLTKCDNCGSWRLVTLGIGIDRIAKEIERLFPKLPVSILDKNNAPTRAEAEAIMKKFASDKGGVLIGTELAFLYLEKIPYSGVVSLDSLFSIPDFSIHEKVFYIVSRLREITENKLLIQTRNVGRDVLDHAKEGNILDFYREEIKEREELFYPPFSIFIKVSTEDTRDEARRKASYLQSQFKEWEPDFIEERGKKAGKVVLSMILRLPRDKWPIEEIYQKLVLLTPDFLVKVDPESIL